MTMNTKWTSSDSLNKHGFAKTDSENVVTKIWSIVADWTVLITGRKLAKHISLALFIHRLSPKKEIITILNKAVHAIPYNDLRLQNEHWESLIDTKDDILFGKHSGVPTHFTFDNNDLKQETTTGHNTSHHKNFLVFQPSPIVNIDIESRMARSRLNFTSSNLTSSPVDSQSQVARSRLNVSTSASTSSPVNSSLRLPRSRLNNPTSSNQISSPVNNESPVTRSRLNVSTSDPIKK